MHSSNTIRLPGLAIGNKGTQAATSAAVSSPADDVSDERLVVRVSEGNREELAILFRRYSRLLRGVALRILRDDSEADDLLQELFLFLYRKASIFDSKKSSFRSWIVQMTYQRAIDRRRYLQSRHFYTRVDLDGVVDLLDPRSQGREDAARFGSLVGNATIEALLHSLTEDQRNTLTLHFFEGYTFGEIAVNLDQSLGNIRNHYYRGLEKLRKQVFPAKLLGRNGYGKK
jgi:RNA polymerase sigma-70 factor (ECF subfamily)